MCLAKRHNAVPAGESKTPFFRPQVYHSTTEPLRSSLIVIKEKKFELTIMKKLKQNISTPPNFSQIVQNGHNLHKH